MLSNLSQTTYFWIFISCHVLANFSYRKKIRKRSHKKKLLSVWLELYETRRSLTTQIFSSESRKSFIKYFPTKSFPAVLFSTNCKHLVPLILVYLGYYYKWLENGKILLVWKRWKWGKFWCVNGGIIWNWNIANITESWNNC